MCSATLKRVRFGILAAGLAMLPQHSRAVSTVTMNIGDVRAAGWSARDVAIALELSGKGDVIAHVSATRVTLSEALGPLERVTVTCRSPTIQPPHFRCRNARVTGTLGKLGRQNFTADVSYESSRGSLVFAVRGLKLGGGTAKIEGRWLEAAIEVHATAEQLTTGNAEGTLATDKLGFEVKAKIEPAGADWKIDAQVRAVSGQAYADPIFVDFGNNALDATLQGRWLSATGGLQIDKLDFDQKGIATGSAAGKIVLGEKISIEKLEVVLASLQFPGAYATLLQPFLLDTEFKEFETAGRISGTVSIEDTVPAAIDLTLDNVTARDKAGKLGIRELQGRVAWSSKESSKGEEKVSSLVWKGANAYGLTGGTARIDFVASGVDFRILKPTVLPILDGGLAIETLNIQNFGEDNMSVRFNAVLQPISMALLSKAFGWPEFGGKIEGRIPQVSYDNKVLSVGGDLEAQAFGGRVVVNGLQLRDPVGNYPRLNANVTLRNLDLEAVTGTFSFGTITGRLDGDIRGLELFRWEPVKMDARLYTPRDDKSRHLISQRAVNNLSNIGGGGNNVAAALSSSFLRFFENFRYQKLGLSCRLENDVCIMDGIEPAAGSTYYIVKGSGIPRIDIIGNAHQVDWSRLVGQLKAIQDSGGPVVQ